MNKSDEGWCTNIIISFYSNLNFFDTKKILYVHNTLYKSIIFLHSFVWDFKNFYWQEIFFNNFHLKIFKKIYTECNVYSKALKVARTSVMKIIYVNLFLIDYSYL